MKLFIAGVPQNANARGGWTGQMRDRAHFRKLAGLVAREHRPQWQPRAFTRITARQVARAHRKRDPTGLAERLKPLLDGLVDAGWLPDDDEEHIEIVLAKTIVDKSRDPGIELELEESYL